MPTASRTLSIIDAIQDANLFGPFFDNDLRSWRRWMVFLRVVFGLPVKTEWGRKLIRQCTGRNPEKLNPEGYSVVLALCGRRSGKSRIAACLVGYLGALAGLEAKLSAGETGVIALVAPRKQQSRIVRGYIRSLYSSPLLENEIVRERHQDSFQLRCGNRLELLASDYRTLRGFTLLGAVIDEVAFLGLEASSKIRTDNQLIQAIEPSLGTTGGKLIAISSPYGKSGWAYEKYIKHFGNDNSKDTLVWNAPSKVMNPTLPQSVLDRAKREDLAAYLSEYEAQFRDDVGAFVSIELVQSLVVPGRKEMLAMPGHKYFAFADVSGGRSDGSALAIAHKEQNTIVLDALVDAPSPHNPYEVVSVMASKCREFGINKVTGDFYSGEFAKQAFKTHNIAYESCPKNASRLYVELLPLLVAKNLELLDHARLVKQIAGLERRTRGAGREVISHSKIRNSHDDLANALAGVCFLANAKRITIGCAGF